VGRNAGGVPALALRAIPGDSAAGPTRLPGRASVLKQSGCHAPTFTQGNVKGALNGKASATARSKVDAILDNLAAHGVDGTQVKVSGL